MCIRDRYYTFNVNVDPNPRSAGAKLDVNDADLAKPIMFQTERNDFSIASLGTNINYTDDDFYVFYKFALL